MAKHTPAGHLQQTHTNHSLFQFQKDLSVNQAGD